MSPFVRAAAATVSAFLLVASLFLAGVAAAATPFVWTVFGFELVSAMACVFAILGAIRAKPADLPMTLACVCVTVGVGTLLGYVGTNPHVVGAFRLMPWVIARLVGVAALGALAGAIALGNDMAAWRRLFRGVLLGLPVVAIVAIAAQAKLRAPVLAWISGIPGPVLALMSVLAFLILTGLLAASVHFTISAFSSRRSPTT